MASRSWFRVRKRASDGHVDQQADEVMHGAAQRLRGIDAAGAFGVAVHVV
jgi:hypothetical protein